MVKHNHKFINWALLSAIFLASFNSCGIFKPKSTAGTEVPKTSNNIAGTVSKDSIGALFLNGMQDLMLEKDEAAFQKFNTVVALQPSHATAHFQLSRLWMAKSNLQKAISEIKLAEKYDPENKWILEYYAGLMVNDKQFLKAAEIYGKLAKSENAPEDYLSKQALCYRWAGKLKESLSVLNQMQKLSPEYDKDLEFQRAQLFYDLKQYDSAIAINQKLIEKDPDTYNYPLALAGIYYKMGDDKKGEQQLIATDKKFPDNSFIQGFLISTYAKSSDSALHRYLNDILLERDNPIETKLEILISLAKSPLSEKKVEQVYEEYLPTLAAQQPFEKDVILFYGLYLQISKQEDSALVQFKKVIDLDSSNNEAWNRLLSIYSDEKTADSLLHYSEKGMDFFPENPLFNYYKSLAFVFKKEPARAVEVLENGLSKIRSEDTFFSITFHSMLGDYYQQINEFKKADSSYRLALKYDSTNSSVLNNYSYFLAVQNLDLVNAEKMAALTIKNNPNQATFLDTYAWVLYKMGNYKEAKKYMQKALKNNVDDGSGVMLEHMGDIEFKLGNPKIALENWLKAQEKGENSEELLEKIKTKQLHD